MKRYAVLFVCLLLPCLLLAQSPKSTSGERLLLPKDAIWGWAEFDVAPPHNEIDPNLCASNARNYGGKDAPCNAFGRYMLSGKIEFRPFGKTQLRRLVIYTDPAFLFGKTVPQALYTWSARPIGLEQSWGVGLDFPYRFQVRVTQHFMFQRFGSVDKSLGPADLGKNGPWGRYNTIGVRKYFGRQREGVQ